MTEANQEFTVSGQLKKITILDSTLRDGAQGEGISFSVQDKINIVKFGFSQKYSHISL